MSPIINTIAALTLSTVFSILLPTLNGLAQCKLIINFMSNNFLKPIQLAFGVVALTATVIKQIITATLSLIAYYLAIIIGRPIYYIGQRIAQHRTKNSAASELDK